MKHIEIRIAGLTLIESIAGIGILCLSLVGFARVVALARVAPEPQHEYALAREAIGRIIDELHDGDFSTVYARYNDDPLDDPGHAGTAPGHRIMVPGLHPSPDGRIGPVGRIEFPSMYDPDEGLQLREDVELPELGMPRDLNGDAMIDSYDHSRDYVLLPVRVHLEWWGAAGHSELETRTLLADF